MATPVRMIAAAASVRDVIDSPAIAQPRKTATSGLTYAYVDAFAGLTVRSRKMYAVNPTREPNETRYSHPTHDWPVTRASCSCDGSPRATPMAMRPTLPPSIWSPVESAAESGRAPNRLNTEP